MFEEGQLGEAPGGGSLTTYRELSALATEMGQPDLLYKFMDLANHATAMASTRGAAFGYARPFRSAIQQEPLILRCTMSPVRGLSPLTQGVAGLPYFNSRPWQVCGHRKAGGQAAAALHSAAGAQALQIPARPQPACAGCNDPHLAHAC